MLVREIHLTARKDLVHGGEVPSRAPLFTAGTSWKEGRDCPLLCSAGKVKALRSAMLMWQQLSAPPLRVVAHLWRQIRVTEFRPNHRMRWVFIPECVSLHIAQTRHLTVALFRCWTLPVCLIQFCSKCFFQGQSTIQRLKLKLLQRLVCRRTERGLRTLKNGFLAQELGVFRLLGTEFLNAHKVTDNNWICSNQVSDLKSVCI